MTLEMVGMIQTRRQSETIPAEGPAFDLDYVARSAQAHEEGGFDRILIGYYGHAADGFMVAAHAAGATRRIGLLLAHRPGFVAPTLAARKLASLDHLSRGRLAVHVISGGDDADQRRDGDWLGHDQRYARTDEYLHILKSIWSSAAPVDHTGAHYRFEKAFSEIKPIQVPHPPIWFGGSSPAALDVAARHADTYALWGETLEQTGQTLRAVEAKAASHGRRPRFSVSFRPVLGATRAEAWERAEAILARIRAVRAEAGLGDAPPPANTGSQRLLDAARKGRVLDRCLWTEVAAVTGARGNTTALVGTPEEVGLALLDYWDLGVETFLVRGFDPLPDAVEYGRSLVPILRELTARRETRRVA